MISYLKGTIFEKTSDYIIIDVGNIGYKVYVSEKTIGQFSEGSNVALFCHLHIKKDDAMELYGVPTFEHLRLFELLKGISGVGPKAALLMSSLGNLKEFQRAIEAGDQEFFSGVKGIGAKKIQKIIFELTGKMKSLDKGKLSKEDEEAVSALSTLGFSNKDAKEALSQMSKDIKTTEDKVKEALMIMKNS